MRMQRTRNEVELVEDRKRIVGDAKADFPSLSTYVCSFDRPVYRTADWLERKSKREFAASKHV